jgi:hypothetical protein
MVFTGWCVSPEAQGLLRSQAFCVCQRNFPAPGGMIATAFGVKRAKQSSLFTNQVLR